MAYPPGLPHSAWCQVRAALSQCSWDLSYWSWELDVALETTPPPVYLEQTQIGFVLFLNSDVPFPLQNIYKQGQVGAL